MNEELVSVKYSTYTPAQKKASQLYRQNNKEKINAQRKVYYQKRKENDPNFLEYKRVKAREYYEKKKLDKVVKPEAVPDVKPEEKVVVDEPKVEIQPVVSPEVLPEVSPEDSEPKKKSKKSKKQ